MPHEKRPTSWSWRHCKMSFSAGCRITQKFDNALLKPFKANVILKIHAIWLPAGCQLHPATHPFPYTHPNWHIIISSFAPHGSTWANLFSFRGTGSIHPALEESLMLHFLKPLFCVHRQPGRFLPELRLRL